MVIFQTIVLFFAIIFSWFTWYQNVFVCSIATKRDNDYETMLWLPIMAAGLWAILIGTFL